MNVSYKNNKLQKNLNDALAIKKHFGENAKRVAARMADLSAAGTLAELCTIPQAACHPLTGDRSGEWAMAISANHRLIFTIDQDPVPLDSTGGIDRIKVTDIRIIEAGTDYH